MKIRKAQVADMFAEDAELGTADDPPQRGREAIRKFLKSFTNERVLSDEIKVNSIDIAGDTGTARGTYKQTAQSVWTRPSMFKADSKRSGSVSPAAAGSSNA